MLTEPIRDKNKLRQLAGYWLKRGNLRNYTLIVMGACTALRIGDLLRLTWEDVYDETLMNFRSHITLTEQKTSKQKAIALNLQAVKALKLYLPFKRGKFIFANNRKDGKAISRVQAWRIISNTAAVLNLGINVSAHGLRKTFGYHAWQSGINPTIIMDIYNHSSYEITKRYLGVSQDDKDKVYMALALF